MRGRRSSALFVLHDCFLMTLAVLMTLVVLVVLLVLGGDSVVSARESGRI